MSLLTDKLTIEDWVQRQFIDPGAPWLDIVAPAGGGAPHVEWRDAEYFKGRATIVVGWEWLCAKFPVSMARWVLGDNDNFELDMSDLLLNVPWWPTVSADEEGDRLYA